MGKIDYTNSEIFAYPKPPKKKKKRKQKLKGKKHKRTKETDIPKKVKKLVWKRDNYKCIFCHENVSWHYANAHYIKRSAGGLGIPENIFTACDKCHIEQDNGFNSVAMTDFVKAYLKSIYGLEWNDEKLIYKKYN